MKIITASTDEIIVILTRRLEASITNYYNYNQSLSEDYLCFYMYDASSVETVLEISSCFQYFSYKLLQPKLPLIKLYNCQLDPILISCQRILTSKSCCSPDNSIN